MSRADEQKPHRLFAAIVLMGSGLAVGCGGVAEGGSQAGSGGAASGSSSSGSGGAETPPVTSAGTGTVAGSGVVVGGATSTSMSGAANAGGSLNIGLAGAPPDEPGPVEPGPFACSPQQWTCQATQCVGPGGSYVLPDECACDPKRPLMASDCQAGEVFVCQRATETKDGRQLTKEVMLACQCLPKSNCFTECQTYGSPRPGCTESQDELSAWCGCAIALLK